MLDLPELRKVLLRGGAALAGAAALASPAAAHHSYAMFDKSKTVTISGTVRTWEMINPHSYLWVVVQKDKDTEIWGLEGASIQALVRSGLNKSSVKPGDKITVDLHPLRDGRTGGMLERITLANGTSVRFGGGGGQANPGGAPPAAE